MKEVESLREEIKLKEMRRKIAYNAYLSLEEELFELNEKLKRLEHAND